VLAAAVLLIAFKNFAAAKSDNLDTEAKVGRFERAKIEKRRAR